MNPTNDFIPKKTDHEKIYFLRQSNLSTNRPNAVTSEKVKSRRASTVGKTLVVLTLIGILGWLLAIAALRLVFKGVTASNESNWRSIVERNDCQIRPIFGELLVSVEGGQEEAKFSTAKTKAKFSRRSFQSSPWLNNLRSKPTLVTSLHLKQINKSIRDQKPSWINRNSTSSLSALEWADLRLEVC